MISEKQKGFGMLHRRGEGDPVCFECGYGLLTLENGQWVSSDRCKICGCEKASQRNTQEKGDEQKKQMDILKKLLKLSGKITLAPKSHLHSCISESIREIVLLRKEVMLQRKEIGELKAELEKKNAKRRENSRR